MTTHDDPIRSESPPARRAKWVVWAGVGALALAVLALMAVIAVRRARAGQAAPAAVEEERAVDVRVMTVEPRRVPDRVTLPATLEAWQDVLVAAEKGGRVVDVPADKGDRVQAGDLLLQLDARQWEALADQARIERADAGRTLGRYDELRQTGAVSDSDYDAVRRRFDLADNALTQALVHVSQCVVRSPIDGRVDDRLVEPGEFPAEGAPVFRVVDVSRLKLALEVPERDVSRLIPGMPVTFRLTAGGDAAGTGTIRFVAAAALPQSHAYRVEAEVDNSDGRLRPGMIAAVTLERGLLEDALLVPLAAVVPERGQHVVYLVRDGRAVRRVVVIGAILGDAALLGSGVEPGDRLVTEGQRTLQDGRRVRVVDTP